MSLAGFEPAISGNEQPQSYPLDRANIGIRNIIYQAADNNNSHRQEGRRQKNNLLLKHVVVIDLHDDS
jgi:hypothetical protein